MTTLAAIQKQIAELQKKARQSADQQTLWLGKGFPWTDIEANKLHTLMALGVVRTIGKAAQKTEGAYWIHGLAPEADLHSELSQLVGHTLIVGTTRVGKTRLFDLLIAQAERCRDILRDMGRAGKADWAILPRRAANFSRRRWSCPMMCWPGRTGGKPCTCRQIRKPC